jgi:hypothetical protein
MVMVFMQLFIPLVDLAAQSQKSVARFPATLFSSAKLLAVTAGANSSLGLAHIAAPGFAGRDWNCWPGP